MNKFASLLICLTGVFALGAHAQQPPAAPGPGGPPAATPERVFISAAELADRISKADAASKAGTKYDGGALLATMPFRAGMEYHDAPATNYAIHEADAELFVVIEGSGTMTLGGALVNPTRRGTNLSATAMTGGTPYKLVKGDMLMVPPNTVHAVTQVDGARIVLMSLHLPLPAGAPNAPATPAAMSAPGAPSAPSAPATPTR